MLFSLAVLPLIASVAIAVPYPGTPIGIPPSQQFVPIGAPPRQQPGPTGGPPRQQDGPSVPLPDDIGVVPEVPEDGETCPETCPEDYECIWGRCQLVWRQRPFAEKRTGEPGSFKMADWKRDFNVKSGPLMGKIAFTELTGDWLMQVAIPRHNVDGWSVGAHFHANPRLSQNVEANYRASQFQNVTLSYDVLFPTNFEWHADGYLPGLVGGDRGWSPAPPKSCGPFGHVKNCFSSQIAWVESGEGTAAIRTQGGQNDGFCQDTEMAPMHCPNRGNGITFPYSVGRDNFEFKGGEWSTVRQSIYLNTFNAKGKSNRDGVFQLYINDKLVVYKEGINFAPNQKYKQHAFSLSVLRKRLANKAFTGKEELLHFKNFILAAH